VRYTFWFLFCALTCYLVAQKSGSVAGPLGAAKVIVYGGVIGLGLAVGTRKELSWGVGLRLVLGILWTLIMMAVYFVVFRSVSYEASREVWFWGFVFAFPAPTLCVLRGVVKVSKKSLTSN
jgi:hypothetical protein